VMGAFMRYERIESTWTSERTTLKMGLMDGCSSHRNRKRGGGGRGRLSDGGMVRPTI
jgi:hypothetical protein